MWKKPELHYQHTLANIRDEYGKTTHRHVTLRYKKNSAEFFDVNTEAPVTNRKRKREDKSYKGERRQIYLCLRGFWMFLVSYSLSCLFWSTWCPRRKRCRPLQCYTTLSVRLVQPPSPLLQETSSYCLLFTAIAAVQSRRVSHFSHTFSLAVPRPPFGGEALFLLQQDRERCGRPHFAFCCGGGSAHARKHLGNVYLSLYTKFVHTDCILIQFDFKRPTYCLRIGTVAQCFFGKSHV